MDNFCCGSNSRNLNNSSNFLDNIFENNNNTEILLFLIIFLLLFTSYGNNNGFNRGF